ncbi:hypothetical protein [Gloeobacter violaceus]|uniref:M61 family metallopeptidase n=1 Tax=Gloeobacter violaceus TaxID=33072 RepID=UPI0002ED860A|nr:hypothetical protein [Gloeobacter violaceus]
MVQDNVLTLDIELYFPGNADGRVELELPSRWANQEKFYENIRDLRPLSAGTRLENTAKPSIKVVRFPAGQPVQLRYRLVQNWKDKLTQSNYFRPILQEDYFQVIGINFLVHPIWENDKPLNVRLVWNSLPEGWTLADSFGPFAPVRNVRSSLSKLFESLFVGGNFRLLQRQIDGQQVEVAIRGQWPFGDDQFADLAARILKIERDLFKDNDFPYYLISVILTEGKPGSLAGTGLTNAFATYLSPGTKLETDLQQLLAHEMLHAWNPQKFGRLAQPEAAMYWFSEGFTDYYTREVLRRAGLMSFEEYIKSVNRSLRDYFVSPVRDADDARLRREFWNNAAMQKLPYLRGSLMALNWNAEIRQISRGRFSLDDAMRSLLAAARQQPGVLDSKRVARAVEPFIGRDTTLDIARFMTAGVPLAPRGDALGPCTVLEDEIAGPQPIPQFRRTEKTACSPGG